MPSYTAGTGSSSGSGGGLVETRSGRTPPWRLADAVDRLAGSLATAIGDTLTGMDYRAAAGDATGAYLITSDMWAGYHGYPTAADAPRDVQDRRAVELVEQLGDLGSGGGPAAIARSWHASVTTTDLFADDFVYWVETAFAATPAAGVEIAPAPVPRLRLGAGEIAFPVLGPVSYGDTFGAPRGGVPGDEEPRCHEGTDIFGTVGQPVLAPVDGIVTIGAGDPHLAGIAVTVTGSTARYNLFHLSAVAPAITNGTRVHAGQIVGYLGATGNAGVPHLHVEIRDGTGAAVASFPLLDAAARRQAGTIGIAPWSSAIIDTATATTHRVVATTTGRGQWTIDTAGRVTATGDAALITPTRQPGPTTPYGTDANG